MAIGPGTRVGPYEVTALLGEGGMGQVWRARHTSLKRDDALKVLPDAFTADPERLARFEREAQVLASLNHANIAQVHGLEEVDGAKALVMELVEGPTLADRIALGPIPVDEALTVAKQIAEALEAAHELGIVHRDLKPANVKVRPDGTVKVLDFGLAKALEPGRPTQEASTSPTITTPAMTRAGMILGTASYMSPEQARGKPADRRADVWAFGCVLFEMLTSQRAFDGDDTSDVLALVLTKEPDWNALPAGTPPVIRRLLRRCLAKDRRARLSDLGTARLDIDEARAPQADGGASEQYPSAHGRERLLWITVAILLVSTLALAAAAYRARSGTTAPAPEMRLEVATPPDSDMRDFALSPDGGQLLFKRGSAFWVRDLQFESARPVPGTDGLEGGWPFWSPDGQSIGFFANDRLKRIELATGVVRDLAAAAQAIGGSWGSSGTILFVPALSSPVLRVPERGGPAIPATHLLPGQVGHRFPQMLPDGQHFLFLAMGTTENRGLYLGTLESPDDARHLMDTDSSATFVAPDVVLFMRSGALMAQRLDLDRRELVGDPEPIAARVIALSNQYNQLLVSASSRGSLVYRTDTSRWQLIWTDRSGREIEAVGEPDGAQQQGLTMSGGRITRDGRLLSLQRTVDGNADVWLLDLTRGVPTRFTLGDERDAAAVWSPDGRRLVFGSERNGVYDLYEKPADGSTADTLLLASSEHKVPEDWSPDGRYLLYHAQHPSTDRDLWVLPMTGARTPQPIATTASEEWAARFSPDGQWIAYDSNESGRSEIYLQRFPGPGGKVQVSTSGGGRPHWRGDGRELYYLAPGKRLMSVPITMPGSDVEVGTPTVLFTAPATTADVFLPSPDGQRFLFSVVVEPPGPLTMLLNWRGLRR
jgi:hypothetical protein